MLVPSLFGENLFDDWFDFPVLKGADQTGRKLYGHRARMLMKADVHERENSYEPDIDLPGFEKDELVVELNNGYLTVSATRELGEEKKDQGDKLIRREHYPGSMQRSFYMGTHVKERDVKAKFEQDVLKLSIPKKTEAKLPKKKTILIEE